MKRSGYLASGLGLGCLLAACGSGGLFGSGSSTSSQGASGGTGGGTGAAATGGVAGTQTTGGQGGAAGGSGGEGGTGGTGKPCLWGGEPCDQGLYCLSDDCDLGTCQPLLDKASELAHLDPQCGCDGVTYYNPTIAQSLGASLAHGGRCELAEAVKCNSLLNPCQAGRHCSQELGNAAACLLPIADGTCWGLPTTCDAAEPPKAHPCIGLSCKDLCTLIKGQDLWYPDLEKTC